MNVFLPPALEKLVNDKVASGQYLTASEVVCEGLLLLEQRDEIREMKLAKLRKEIQIGIEQARQGRTKPLDPEEIKERLRKHLAEQKRQKEA